MSVRSKVTGSLVVGLGVLVVGSAVLRSPSDDIDRIRGADRVNSRDGVLLTVKFTPTRTMGGPLAVAVTWYSSTSFFGPPVDAGNAAPSLSPFQQKIKAVKGASITAAAVPAKRDHVWRPFWTTECWLHQNGVLLPGTHSHDGPNPGGQGCKVSGTAQ